MKRKHRVVVEITTAKPMTEKRAARFVATALENYFSPGPYEEVSRVAAKTFTRVYIGERSKDPSFRDACFAEGNRGGSFIELEKTSVEGMLHLCVGETCVITVNQAVSVAGLAAILTYAKDRGFQKVVDEYLETAGGSPVISVDYDMPPRRGE